MHHLLQEYSRESRPVLERLSPETLTFTDACGGAGISGQEHTIALASISLADHDEGDLKKLASAASVLSGKGNNILWLTPSYPQSTRHHPSIRDQAIGLIADCLYPGGGGVSGEARDGKKNVATNRTELNSIAAVGRFGRKWPPYVYPDCGE